VIQESPDILFKVYGKIVAFEQDPVLQRLMPSFGSISKEAILTREADQFIICGQPFNKPINPCLPSLLYKLPEKFVRLIEA
jgi:hypothetical protein